jgi:hypothetical protein
MTTAGMLRNKIRETVFISWIATNFNRWFSVFTTAERSREDWKMARDAAVLEIWFLFEVCTLNVVSVGIY